MAAARKTQLTKYNAKRDFKKTAEPSGKLGPRHAKSLIYMIQKHAASHLHFDFRLEWNGVLKSWAVAKGPSLNPQQKRLAVQVEDHPVAYATFEGTIPQGQYGGGTVMLWDRGTWEPIGDVEKGLAAGRLNFRLHGERLQGDWHLVRMGGKSAGDRRQNWLLIKSHDAFADDGAADKVIEQYTVSVATGRTMDEIAAGNKVWTAKGAVTKKPGKQSAAKKAAVKSAPKVKGKAAALPDFIAPQLATLVDAPPAEGGWVHEVKFDGYRALVRIDGKSVQMITRANNDWTEKFLNLPDEFKKLGLQTALIDGEVVVPDAHGRTSFHALQNILGRFGNRKNLSGELHYYAFDLLYLNGQDLRGLPLTERKAALRKIIPAHSNVLHYSEDFAVEGGEVLKNACHMKLEGVVSKRADAPYTSGRGKGWLKSKCIHEQEMVIGGYTLQPKHPDRIAALLIGHYQDGKLIFAGKAGTGFTQAENAYLLSKLTKLNAKENPFGAVPASYRRGSHWVKPKLLAQIAFTEWTPDGMLRHPVYQGLREDKPARQVIREVEQNVAEPGAVQLTHPDKILYPATKTTKQDLADYYAKVAPLMLPHLAGFPVSLVRCPNGSNKTCFFQRHSEVHSALIEQVPIELNGEVRDFITIHDAAGLKALVQMGALEIHAWGARGATADLPERVVFDFDPDEGLPFARVKEAALDMRKRLKKLGLESFLKTTGGKGLHVVVPFKQGPTWDEVRNFSEAMAGLMAEDAPDRYTVNVRKVTRKGKIYIDYLRNNKSASAIAPYSTRAKDRPTISLPLAWSELKNLKTPNGFTIDNFPARRKDPWADMEKLKQTLKLK